MLSKNCRFCCDGVFAGRGTNSNYHFLSGPLDVKPPHTKLQNTCRRTCRKPYQNNSDKLKDP